jgi:hypothetical protein
VEPLDPIERQRTLQPTRLGQSFGGALQIPRHPGRGGESPVAALIGTAVAAWYALAMVVVDVLGWSGAAVALIYVRAPNIGE